MNEKKLYILKLYILCFNILLVLHLYKYYINIIYLYKYTQCKRYVYN